MTKKSVDIFDDGSALHSVYFPGRRAVDYVEDMPSLTRQEFADEADINKIMKQYEAHGVVPSVIAGEPQYMDTSLIPNNLLDAMNGLIEAETSFMRLHANIRREFENDPVAFAEFAVKEENRDKLREWGLLKPEEPLPAIMKVEVVNPPPAQPAPTTEAPKAS